MLGEPIALLVPAAAPLASAIPAISGTPTAGQTLTASTGTWSGSPASYSYVWRRCKSTTLSSCTTIAGAVKSTYTLTGTDDNRYVRVAVIATGSGGSTLGPDSNPTAKITRLAPVSTPTGLSISNARETEGDSDTKAVSFTITRSGTINGNSSVTWETADGTANSGDYVGTYSTLYFGANQTTKTVVVNVKGDTADEDDETFKVVLSEPTNAGILAGSGTGTATIVDDDGGR